jgi:hypothetical protein
MAGAEKQEHFARGWKNREGIGASTAGADPQIGCGPRVPALGNGFVACGDETCPEPANLPGPDQLLRPPALLSCHIMPNDMSSATTKTSVVM